MLMKLATKLNLCVQQWIYEDPEDLGMNYHRESVKYTLRLSYFFRISLSQPEIHL